MGTSDKPREVTKNITGDAASELMGVWDSTYTEPEFMQWDSGDLSLINGVMLQGEVARGHANQRSRRVLKHMRYDQSSGHFVPTEKGRRTV